MVGDEPMSRLLHADEVAAKLGMTRDWVYAQSRAGRIPAVKLGRYYRYREASVDAWIEALEGGRVPGDKSMGGHRANGPAPA